MGRRRAAWCWRPCACQPLRRGSLLLLEEQLVLLLILCSRLLASDCDLASKAHLLAFDFIVQVLLLLLFLYRQRRVPQRRLELGQVEYEGRHDLVELLHEHRFMARHLRRRDTLAIGECLDWAGDTRRSLSLLLLFLLLLLLLLLLTLLLLAEYRAQKLQLLWTDLAFTRGIHNRRQAIRVVRKQWLQTLQRCLRESSIATSHVHVLGACGDTATRGRIRRHGG